MAELTISAAVGAPPSPNRPDDVRTVQQLLQGVQPPLAANVGVTGVMDAVTLRAIREFQQRFMRAPDGKVTPNDRTLFHLNNGAAPQYLDFTPQQRLIIDRDLMNAQTWLNAVNLRLLNIFNDKDVKLKVRNVFHIDMNFQGDPRVLDAYFDLLKRFRNLRDSLDIPFPLQAEHDEALEIAWVVQNDRTGTMHFSPGYFRAADKAVRTEKIVHERSHTIFRIGHEGMIPGGEVDFDRKPEDDNGLTYVQAIRNAYCYGWLATVLQPGYRRLEW